MSVRTDSSDVNAFKEDKILDDVERANFEFEFAQATKPGRQKRK